MLHLVVNSCLSKKKTRKHKEFKSLASLSLLLWGDQAKSTKSFPAAGDFLPAWAHPSSWVFVCLEWQHVQVAPVNHITHWHILVPLELALSQLCSSKHAQMSQKTRAGSCSFRAWQSFSFLPPRSTPSLCWWWQMQRPGWDEWFH